MTTKPKYLHEWWVNQEGRDVNGYEKLKEEAEARCSEAEEDGKGGVFPSLTVAFEWACAGRITTSTDASRGHNVYSVFVTQPDCSTYRGNSTKCFGTALRRAYRQLITDATPAQDCKPR